MHKSVGNGTNKIPVMNDACESNPAAGTSKQCPQCCFLIFFLILLLLKITINTEELQLCEPATAPFYSGRRCKTPPSSHSQSVWFLCTPWHVCNAVDHISNRVICEEDIMQYCVRPVYTYANTNRHCLHFVFPRRHQCFWNEADSKHFLFVTF